MSVQATTSPPTLTTTWPPGIAAAVALAPTRRLGTGQYLPAVRASIVDGTACTLASPTIERSSPSLPRGLRYSSSLASRAAGGMPVDSQAPEAVEVAIVGPQPVGEAVRGLVLALGLGARGRAGPQVDARLLDEAPRAPRPRPLAVAQDDRRAHVVGGRPLGDAPEEQEGLEQAEQQVVRGAGRRADEPAAPRAARRRGKDVELEGLARGVDHPQALLPVEPRLAARGRLEPGVRLGALGGGQAGLYAPWPAELC